MCRFLLVKSSEVFSPHKILTQFSEMAKDSRTFDGDWQGDGWGVSWQDQKGEWQVKKSLLPVWENEESFRQIPRTKLLIVHARSASFVQHKNNLDYNQPFVEGKYGYVFNGLLKGVTLKQKLNGVIGAQKIWSLLKGFLLKDSVEESLSKVNEIMKETTREVQAMNIGVSDKVNIYALCQFSSNPDYYSLWYMDTPQLKIICSEKIDGFKYERANYGEVISL